MLESTFREHTLFCTTWKAIMACLLLKLRVVLCFHATNDELIIPMNKLTIKALFQRSQPSRLDHFLPLVHRKFQLPNPKRLTLYEKRVCRLSSSDIRLNLSRSLQPFHKKFGY